MSEVTMNYTFDLDCDDDREKFEKMSNLFLDNEEEEEVEEEQTNTDDDEDSPDYESAYVELSDTINDMYDDAKEGTVLFKKLKELKTATAKIAEDYGFEL